MDRYINFDEPSPSPKAYRGRGFAPYDESEGVMPSSGLVDADVSGDNPRRKPRPSDKWLNAAKSYNTTFTSYLPLYRSVTNNALSDADLFVSWAALKERGLTDNEILGSIGLDPAMTTPATADRPAPRAQPQPTPTPMPPSSGVDASPSTSPDDPPDNQEATQDWEIYHASDELTHGIGGDTQVQMQGDYENSLSSINHFYPMMDDKRRKELFDGAVQSGINVQDTNELLNYYAKYESTVFENMSNPLEDTFVGPMQPDTSPSRAGGLPEQPPAPVLEHNQYHLNQREAPAHVHHDIIYDERDAQSLSGYKRSSKRKARAGDIAILAHYI